jgi:hypothetical protein
MKEEKRQPHSYKCKKSVYKKAMQKAKKDKTTLAKLIENFIEGYIR